MDDFINLTLPINNRDVKDIIQLDKVAFMIDSGDNMKINAVTKSPGNIIWKSSNEKVATVTRDGVVNGVSFGDTVISASISNATAYCIASVDYKGQNPTLPPTWGLYIADGEPHVFNGKMYIYGSRDVTNGFWENGERDFCAKDYHVIYSEDLIHWVDAGVSISMEDISKDILGDARRLWAPDMFKSPTEEDKYYLTACTNNGKYIIAEGDRPEGSFYNSKEMTMNGKSLNTIDPGILVDKDGKVYMALPNFYICQLDPSDFSRILPNTYTDVKKFMPKDNEPFEGPSLVKRGEIYYYIYIQNKGNIEKDGAVPTIMGYMTSKNPLGPYTYQGVIITNYNYPASGNIHGSIEEFKGQWYVSYHMPLAELSLTRMHYMDKLEFNEDGTIMQVLPTSSGIKGSFSKGEKIQASSGIIFSGGRDKIRFQTRMQPTDNEYVFYHTDYPYAFFKKAGEWIGYRYMNFTTDINKIIISVSTESDGASLEVHRGSESGDIVSSFIIPSTEGKFKLLKFGAVVKNLGVDEFYFVLNTEPDFGDVKVDWFSFY